MIKELFSNEINVLDYSVHIKGVGQDLATLPTAKLYVTSTTVYPTSGSALTVTEDNTDPDIAGRYKVIVPRDLLAKNRFAKVEFEYTLPGHGTIKETDIFRVAQRLVSFDEVNYVRGKDESGDSYAVDYDQYNIAETEARHIIQAYCNQEFTYWEGPYSKVSNRMYVTMPQYISELTGISFSDDTVYVNFLAQYQVADSGFSIYAKEITPRATIFSGPREENSIIATIEGVWGYESVPMAIQQAALELINYYLSDDIDHRRRYYNQVTNRGSENFTYHWTSYSDSTGNPLVDALLQPFRIFGSSAI